MVKILRAIRELVCSVLAYHSKHLCKESQPTPDVKKEGRITVLFIVLLFSHVYHAQRYQKNGQM